MMRLRLGVLVVMLLVLLALTTAFALFRPGRTDPEPGAAPATSPTTQTVATPPRAGNEPATARTSREGVILEVEVRALHGRKPVAGATVRLSGDAATEARTGPNGRAAIARPPKADRLKVSAPGFLDEEVGVASSDERAPTVLLRRIAEVDGVVWDESCRPISGCKIEVVAGADRGRTTTDGNGRFVLDGLLGRFCLVVIPPEGQGVWRTPRTATVRGGDRDVRIMLEREMNAWAQARVLAIDAGTGAPLPIAACDLERAEPTGSVFIESPDCLIDAGIAVFDAMPAGQWEVSVVVEDGRLAHAVVDLAHGVRKDVRIQVPATLTLRGKVTGATGSGIYVMLVPPSGKDANNPAAVDAGFALVQPDGSYDLRGVSRRPCTLRVTRGDVLGLHSWDGNGSDTVAIDVVCRPAVPVVFELGTGVALDGILLLRAEDGRWRDTAITSPSSEGRNRVVHRVAVGAFRWEYRFFDRDREGRATAAIRRGVGTATAANEGSIRIE